MSYRKCFTGILAAALLVLSACSQSRYSAAVTGDPRWVELSRFFAGMPVEETSRLYGLTQSKAYQQHAAFMDGFWKSVSEGNISRIASWRDSHMGKFCRDNTAFYPLSGADLVNFYSIYPHAPAYVMVALERIGSIDDPASFSGPRLERELHSIRRFIMSIASRNYLISNTMESEIEGSRDLGVAPVLLIFAARLGFVIRDVERILLLPDGTVIPQLPGQVRSQKDTAEGLRIRFFRGDRTERSIVYFQMRLRGDSLAEQASLARYLKNAGDLNTMLKSAIYLLHYRNYRDFCHTLLDRSCMVVQDDSGVPYRYFLESGGFQITLFGKYDTPVSLKDILVPPRQADLAAAYRQKNIPLDFNFGYGAKLGPGRSNLLLARKTGEKSGSE
ncbi:MAG: hypothetical protein CVV44_11365 [Spirochaetae bacterium HGW-Spirochaetae-1]|nr:MAG: hypothetical protein CVV44_11365 [Spirochaetae bacterium HGW-Spirochaetae-1]